MPAIDTEFGEILADSVPLTVQNVLRLRAELAQAPQRRYVSATGWGILNSKKCVDAMEQILDYTVPVLHPLVVHFPIAFTLAAAVCGAVWMFSDRMSWLTATIWLTVAAFAGALAAVLSGEQMEEQSEGVPIVETFVETHETLGLASLWTLGILVLAFAGLRYTASRDVSRAGSALWARVLGGVLIIGAALLVTITAHYGGVMVWGVAR